MSDALSFVEIDGQHVELLPARTVMSLLHTGGDSSGRGGNGGEGGKGGAGRGDIGVNLLNIDLFGDQLNSAGDGTGGAGGAANGGNSGALNS
jgi:hypothetical protein